MRVSLALVVERTPTAVQAVVEMHVIPARLSLSVVLAFGLGTIDQVVPFHCSMRVCSMRFWLEELPTAKQAEAEGQEMLTRVLPVVPAFGLGTTDQAAEAAATGVNETRAPRALVPAKASSETTATESRLVARACFGLRPIPIFDSRLPPLDRVLASAATTLHSQRTLLHRER